MYKMSKMPKSQRMVNGSLHLNFINCFAVLNEQCSFLVCKPSLYSFRVEHSRMLCHHIQMHGPGLSPYDIN